jgi:hypothetical protein
LFCNAEDPRIFAQRVAKAHRDRKYADAQIRYNFYIDNMPTDGLLELDSEQTSRILSMAVNKERLKSKLGTMDSNFFNEANKYVYYNQFIFKSLCFFLCFLNI